MKFKQAFLMEPRRFELLDVEIEKEDLEPDEVLVKITSCGLCPSELPIWVGDENYYGYPHPLGHEFAGEVVMKGSDVDELKIGDKVACYFFGHGAFAEYKVVQAHRCIKLKDDIDPKYALGEPQKCVITVVNAADPKPGDYGVIVGCGPMGLLCIQALAGGMLAGLIAVDTNPARLELAKQFGADYCVNAAEVDAEDAISEITDGHMGDFVIEGTGVPAVLNNCIDYIRGGGAKLVMMSISHGSENTFDFQAASSKGLDLCIAQPPHASADLEDFRRAVAMINNHKFHVKDMCFHEYALADINQAFADLEKKPEGYVKGIVCM